MNTTLEINNDGVNSFSMNMTTELFVAINKVWIYFKINVPENEHDKSYQKTFLKTVIDVEKAIKGISGNFLVQKIGESFFEAKDFDLIFPIKKVSANFTQQPFILFSNLQIKGIYRYTNLTFSDDFIPFNFDFKVFVELKYMGKVGKSKKTEHLSTSKAVIEFIPKKSSDSRLKMSLEEFRHKFIDRN